MRVVEVCKGERTTLPFFSLTVISQHFAMSTPLLFQARTLWFVVGLLAATPFAVLVMLVYVYRMKRSHLESECKFALSLSKNVLPMEKRRVAAEGPQGRLVREVDQFSMLIAW